MVQNVLFWINSMDLPKWVRQGSSFFRLAKNKVGDDQDWQSERCSSAAVCHLDCSVSLLHSGPWKNPTLGRAPRATASPWSPKSSRPEASPWLTFTQWTRTNNKPIKIDQQRSNTTKNKGQQKRSTTSKNDHPKSESIGRPSKTIKKHQKMINNVLGPTLAQSEGLRQPPKCFLEADHSHDCGSMFFISCSHSSSQNDCPLRMHTYGPVHDEYVFSEKKDTFLPWAFLDTGSMTLFGDGKKDQKQFLKKRSTTFFTFGVFGPSDAFCKSYP